MKKFIIGLLCGTVLTATSTAFASDFVKAFLFPVKLVFNGETKDPGDDNPVLNYNGKTYVPLRFLSETMGASVGYNGESQTVSVDYITDEGLRLHDAWVGGAVQAGNLRLTAEDGKTTVKGQVLLDKHFANEKSVGFSLRFYDEAGNSIGNVGYTASLKPGEIRTFEATGDGDFSNYAAVTMEAGYSQMGPAAKGFPPGELTLKDPNYPLLALGDLRIDSADKFNRYSRVAGHVRYDNTKPGSYKASLHFYDKEGSLLGTASLLKQDWTVSGGVSTFEAVGKGNFQKYDTVTLEVIPVENSSVPSDMEQTEVTVTLDEETAVYEKPDSASRILGKLSPQSVKAYGKWKDWYYIYSWAGPGWIKKVSGQPIEN